MDYIDEFLVNLLDAGLSGEQLRIVRKMMAQYALAAVMDSDVREEVELICME